MRGKCHREAHMPLFNVGSAVLGRIITWIVEWHSYVQKQNVIYWN